MHISGFVRVAALVTKIQAIFLEMVERVPFLPTNFLKKRDASITFAEHIKLQSTTMRACFNDNFLLSSYCYEKFACLKHL